MRFDSLRSLNDRGGLVVERGRVASGSKRGVVVRVSVRFGSLRSLNVRGGVVVERGCVAAESKRGDVVRVFGAFRLAALAQRPGCVG